MSRIDWSKAPEWADGHGLVAHHGITEVWVSPEQYAVVGAEDRAYPYGGGTGDHRHNFTRGQVQYITPRPARWDGEGLPPVGLEVECTFDSWGYWLKGKVLCYGEKMIFMEQESSKGDGKFEGSMNPDGIRFRPIRTPEQIAADERLHKIRNAHTRIATTLDQFKQDIPGQSVARIVIEAMIDAGYSKQVAP